MKDEENNHSAELAAGVDDTGSSATETAGDQFMEMAALRLERDLLKRALSNHLCPHDMADWMGCSFNHVELCAICQHDNGTEHTWLVRLERADAAAVKLRAAIAEWRVTADIWERHARYELVSAEDKWGHDHPPQAGMGAIRNWINWLRNKATEVEVIINESATATKASSSEIGSVPSEAQKKDSQ